jgi:tetratricopeptide (TPR) repeat protein
VDKALELVDGRIPVEAAEAHREAGLIRRELGEMRHADRHWRASLELFPEAGHHEEAAKTARLLAEYLRDDGRLHEALEVYARATASLEEIR